MSIGNCEEKHHRWYYDAENGYCRSFTYTGCGGNGNRFDSIERCEQICVIHKWKGTVANLLSDHDDTVKYVHKSQL